MECPLIAKFIDDVHHCYRLFGGAGHLKMASLALVTAFRQRRFAAGNDSRTLASVKRMNILLDALGRHLHLPFQALGFWVIAVHHHCRHSLGGIQLYGWRGWRLTPFREGYLLAAASGCAGIVFI